MKKNKIIILIVLISGSLILLKLVTKPIIHRQSSLGKRAIEKIVVKAMTAKREDIDLILSYVGGIKAKDEVNVFSKVTGKLVEYTVDDGDIVEKGETIALIDRDETGLKYELAKVDSPIGGVVGRTLLDKGANILTTTNVVQGTPIATIVNMDNMIVKLNIPEIDIPFIKRGLKTLIKVDAYPQDIFEGEISKVSQIVDSQTRTLPIEITIRNDDHRLKSGMFCRIKIIASSYKDSIVLLQDALVQEEGENYIFLVDDHTAKKRKVKLGIRQDTKIQILDGVKEDQKVIIFGQQGLKDGTHVETVQE